MNKYLYSLMIHSVEGSELISEALFISSLLTFFIITPITYFMFSSLQLLTIPLMLGAVQFVFAFLELGDPMCPSSVFSPLNTNSKSPSLTSIIALSLFICFIIFFLSFFLCTVSIPYL